MPSRTVHLIRKPLLALAVTALALLVAEFVVAWLRPAPPVSSIWMDDPDSFYQRSTNPIRRYELKPGFQRSFPVGVATINEHGLRDRPRTIEKPAGIKRILVLGDSVVEGVNYVGDKDTITRQWEAMYEDGKIEVLNFGNSGYCSLAEIELLKQKGLAFSPDIVVVVFTNNDFHNYNLELTLAGGVVNRPTWAKQLFINSHLFRHLCLATNLFDFATETDPAKWNQQAIGDNNVVDALRALRELSEQYRFSVLIAVWPGFNDQEIFDTHFMSTSTDGDLVIERLARMNGFPVVRLSMFLEEHWKSIGAPGTPREYFSVRGDGMHATPIAGKVAASGLNKLIKSTLPAPPYVRQPTDSEAVNAARRIGGNRVHETVSMEERINAVLRVQGRTDESENYLRSLLKTDPDSFFAHRQLGIHLAELNRTTEARTHFNEALRIKPDDATVYLAIGQLDLMRDDPMTAREWFERAAAIDPESAAAHFLLGLSYAQTQHWHEAERHFRACLRINPQHPDAQFFLKQVLKESTRQR